MEQYVQLLIPAKPRFVPQPEQIAEFLKSIESFGFQLDWNQPYMHGLRVFQLLSKAEIAAAIEASGMFPLLERFELNGLSEIPSKIRTLQRFSVNAVVAWQGEESPIRIPTALWPESRRTLTGSVSFEVHPEPVVTSNVWFQDGEYLQSRFREPAEEPLSVSVFTHPLSSRNLEIPNAGSARFWLGFDFGEWVVPHLPEDFSLLNPALVELAEEHFGVKMSEAGLALP
jgi:hypothetical protein